MRYLKKLTLILTICFAGMSLTAARAQNVEDPKQFVSQIGNEIIKILVQRETPMSQRKEEFRQVLRKNFDIKSIGKFVLARYWRQANDGQKEEYLKLFENAIVDNYAAQFDNYNNETLEVDNSREGKDGGILVQSHINRTGGTPPLQVDWKIFQTKSGLRVLDIIVNGVSMSITQRTEYAGIISSAGGSIDGLLTELRKKHEMQSS